MSSPLLRSDLIARLAQAMTEVPAAQVEEAVKTVINALAETLASGDRIEIRGFGSFSVHVHPPRLARNPKTGEKVEIGEKRTPHFKPGKELRDRVDQA